MPGEVLKTQMDHGFIEATMPRRSRLLESGLHRPPSAGHLLTERGDGNPVRIPEPLRHDVARIFRLTDPFCGEHLDAEYAELVRKLIGRLARTRAAPRRGTAMTSSHRADPDSEWQCKGATLGDKTARKGVRAAPG